MNIQNFENHDSTEPVFKKKIFFLLWINLWSQRPNFTNFYFKFFHGRIQPEHY